MRASSFTRLVGSMLVTLAIAPRAAHASPSYPGLIKTDLTLDYDLGTDHCTICHQTNAGGVGTATQPFGKAMKSAGLVLENPSALQTALQTLAATQASDDCDGSYIDQLKAGRDPNPPHAYIDGSGKPTPTTFDAGCSGDAGPNTMPNIDTPVYGCDPGPGAAQVASGPLSSSGAMGLATLLGLSALATRRGRRKARGRSARD